MVNYIFANAQANIPVKDSFIIESLPYYDVNGNLYMFQKKFSHLPLKEDSALFYKEIKESLRQIRESVERAVEAEQKRIDKVNRAFKADQKQYAALFPREGKHLFSLHWISWQKFGSVNIKKIAFRKYSVNGYQKDDKGNYVTIDGFLFPEEKGVMKFTGSIVTKTSGNNKGEPCVKKGNYTFKSSPGRKYWRLQEMENCEGGALVDYVDIFF